MSFTAAKIGASPLTLDWTHLKAQVTDPSVLAQAWQSTRNRFVSKEIGFYDAPVDGAISNEAECRELAQRILDRKQFTDCLFLGIGGSALGPLSLLQALTERANSGIRFHFLENPDPLDCKTTLARLDPETTLVCVVTKSGTTFETIAQFLIAQEWLGRPRWTTHLVAITDPEKGDLRAWAREEAITTLPIAPTVGGRFSIFTPVGLFAAALAGLSVPDFLNGARQVRDYCEKTLVEKNALLIIGADLVRKAKPYPTHVCMPYSTRLRSIGLWWVQLWGESLGKDGKGFTPLAAVGATDQHSILQLLRDGPDDKVTLFMRVDHVEDPVKIPKLSAGKILLQGNAFPAFRLLEGHTLHNLLQTEYQAISLVLTRRGRPHLTFVLDRLDERTLGALYFAWSVITAFVGTLKGVNPFDQPGVEEGKVYIKESLSRESDSARQAEDQDDNSPVARLRRHRIDSHSSTPDGSGDLW